MWDMEEGLCLLLHLDLLAVPFVLLLLIRGSWLLRVLMDLYMNGGLGMANLTSLNLGRRTKTWNFGSGGMKGQLHALHGSWDMTVRIWDRSPLKCLKVCMHSDWVWSLAPHDTTMASTSGSDIYVWDNDTGKRLTVINNAHVGNAYSLAGSHTGKLLFTGGEGGTINMFEIVRNGDCNVWKMEKWIPHTGPVYSLAFEFPWLVSASSDGKLSLIDVRKLLKTSRHFSTEKSSKFIQLGEKTIEPPQRMLHGFGPNLFSVDVSLDRIVCGGEGVVRIWNFSQALEIERRVRSLRGLRLRLENRMRRRKLQAEMNARISRNDQRSVASKKNQIAGDRNSWHNRHRVNGKLKA